MLGEILPDLLLLAVPVVFILREAMRSSAADRARGRAAASPRNRQTAASAGSRRCASRASAMAMSAERATHICCAPRTMQGVEPRAPSVGLHQDHARATVLPPAPEETHDGQS
jgi:hypothetical protein